MLQTGSTGSTAPTAPPPRLEPLPRRRLALPSQPLGAGLRSGSGPLRPYLCERRRRRQLAQRQRIQGKGELGGPARGQTVRAGPADRGRARPRGSHHLPLCCSPRSRLRSATHSSCFLISRRSEKSPPHSPAAAIAPERSQPITAPHTENPSAL